MPFYEIGYDGDDIEILGADEYLLGNEYLLGASKRPSALQRARAVMKRPVASQMIAAKKVQQGTLVEAKPPTRAQELVIGFDSVTTIAAGAAGSVTSRPQEIFRPERLVVPNAIAPSFLLTDFRVGKNSQFLNATAVPAEGFSANAVGVRLKCDTAQVNTDLVLNVQNISLGALRFTAMVTGTALS